MVGATGFEPATTHTPSECATRLRHAPSLIVDSTQERQTRQPKRPFATAWPFAFAERSAAKRRGLRQAGIGSQIVTRFSVSDEVETNTLVFLVYAQSDSGVEQLRQYRRHYKGVGKSRCNTDYLNP